MYKNILNNGEAYENMMAKVKSIMDMKKFESQTQRGASHFNEEAGFILIDAQGETNGEIVMMNEAFRTLVKIPKPKDNEGQGSIYKMNSIMPEIVANKHDSFIETFD